MRAQSNRGSRLDGFRLDLASIFMRDSSGSLNYGDPAIIAEITSYLAKNVRLIAETRQGQPGSGYVLGRSFPGLGWQQWNGKFRDHLRGFVKGDTSDERDSLQIQTCWVACARL